MYSRRLIFFLQVAVSELEQNRWHDMWLSVRSEGEEEREKSKGGRMLQAMAKPSTSVANCFLRVRVQWRKWTDQEADFIKQVI